MKRACEHGFTIAEMAIVITIIGVIVGAIFVGLDLIRAAKMHKLIGDYQKLVTGTSAFKLKYNHLPGDIPDPTVFGFSARLLPPLDQCTGDGDGLIEDPNCTSPNHTYGGDLCGYWMDMRDAGYYPNFIACDRTGVEQMLTEAAVYLESGHLDGMDKWLSVMPVVANGQNYLWMGGISAWDWIGNDYTLDPRLSPYEAYAIDSKVDDGAPLKGKAVAVNPASGTNQTLGVAAIPGATDCVAVTGNYNLTQGGTKLCHLLLPLE